MIRDQAGETGSPEDRYERERLFHDERFGASEARSADGFYVINTACEAQYASLIRRAQPGQRVLEYGCGTGSWAFELAGRGVEVVGIDISPVAVAHATKTADDLGLEGIEFCVMNAEALEFADASFDLVCGSGILHHLDIDRAMGEISRILTPTGRAVFVEPLGHNPIINLYRRVTPGMRTPDEHPLLQRDLDRFSQGFGSVTTRSYVLLALLAVPLRKLRSFAWILDHLNRADAALFRRLPGLSRFGWTTIIELNDPIPAQP